MWAVMLGAPLLSIFLLPTPGEFGSTLAWAVCFLAVCALAVTAGRHIDRTWFEPPSE